MDGLDDALNTLSRFNGSGQVYSVAVSTNSSDTILHKRDNVGFWVSFVGWGGNTGYMQDLFDWKEFDRIFNSIYGNGGDYLVQQTQSCNVDYHCFSYTGKACLTIGFAQEQGVNDAATGEVYYMSYGGLDNDCESG